MPIDDMETRHKTAQRVRLARKDAGFTQSELAAEIGVTPQAISNYERELNRIPYSVLNDVSKLCGVTIEYLLGITDIPHSTEGYSKSGEMAIDHAFIDFMSYLNVNVSGFVFAPLYYKERDKKKDTKRVYLGLNGEGTYPISLVEYDSLRDTICRFAAFTAHELFNDAMVREMEREGSELLKVEKYIETISDNTEEGKQ